MMSFRHLLIGALLLGLGLAGTATGAVTKTYSVAAGSGGQLAIGGGLPLPIQPTFNATAVGTVFPPLLVPAAPGATVMQTMMLGKGKKLVVPTGVLRKPASWKMLGQNANNPALYVVATDLEYSWPAQQATFSSAARTGLTTTSVTGAAGTITYSNALGRKFGGPAQFKFTIDPTPPPATGGAGPQGNLKTNVAVSLYVIYPPAPSAAQAPCTHPAFLTNATPVPGPIPASGDPVGGVNINPACVAFIAELQPSQTAGGAPALAAPGGGQVMSPYTATTPGGTPMAFTGPRVRNGPKPGIGVVKAATGAFHPAGPRGSISLFAYIPTGASSGTGITNMASSSGFPWTTGMLTISAPAAGGAGELWMLIGKDARHEVSGGGVLQMVSGALSQRAATGDNGNRGWVRLVLVGPEEVPALSPMALAATAGLMLLAAGYAMRRRFSA
jgi:hypothetical protein